MTDCQGTWYGEGNEAKVTYTSPEEAELFYDLIEWVGVQECSSGLVGLSGVSYLALMQVCSDSKETLMVVACGRIMPPGLGCINPDEGTTLFLR